VASIATVKPPACHSQPTLFKKENEKEAKRKMEGVEKVRKLNWR